jgi:hypothetical protein
MAIVNLEIQQHDIFFRSNESFSFFTNRKAIQRTEAGLSSRFIGTLNRVPGSLSDTPDQQRSHFPARRVTQDSNPALWFWSLAFKLNGLHFLPRNIKGIPLPSISIL